MQFDWNNIVIAIVITLVAITWHELAHALTAQYLGDDTPRRTGHLSLNPFNHMDQTGIILLFLSAVSFNGNGCFAFGFTPVNERQLRPNPKTGGGIVAVMGPLSNVILAALLAIPLRFNLFDLQVHLFDPSPSPFQLSNILYRAIFLNLFLAIFNIIPIPPLDGWRVLETFLSPRQLYELRSVRQYGPFILLVIFLFGARLGFFGWLDNTFVNPFGNLLVGINIFG